MKSHLKSTKSLFFILSFILLFGSIKYGQAQILLENVDGKDLLSDYSMIKTDFGINVNANSTNKTLGFLAYRKLDKEIIAQKLITFSVKGKASNNYSTIISNGEVNPGVEFSSTYFQKHLFLNQDNNLTDWFTFSAGFEISKFNFYDSSAAYSDQFFDKEYSGLKLKASYSLFFPGDNTSKDRILSLGFNYLKANNTGGLKSTTVNDIITVPSSFPNNYRELVSSKTVIMGEYNEYDSYDLSLSLSFLPSEKKGSKNSGISFFALRNFKEVQNTMNLGVVYFITKQNSTSGQRTPVLGLSIQANDVFDEKDKDTTFDERIIVGITSSISLNKVLGS